MAGRNVLQSVASDGLILLHICLSYLFTSCHNVAISLYVIIVYAAACVVLGTYVLLVCHLQKLIAIPSGTQVMSLVLDWISKDLYLLSTQGGQLVVYSWSTQGGRSLQRVYSVGTSLTEVTGRISPFSG